MYCIVAVVTGPAGGWSECSVESMLLRVFRLTKSVHVVVVFSKNVV